MVSDMNWESEKQRGNDLFKAQSYTDALSAYTSSLKLCDNKSQKDDRCALYKNRSMCHLKLEQWQKCVDDASKALELAPSDVKALFRRCQAYEKLEKYEDAFKDCKRMVSIDPKNAAAQDLFRNLRERIQNKINEGQSTSAMIEDMYKCLQSAEETAERKEKAVKNLTIYAHQNAGSEYIFNSKLLQRLAPTLSQSETGVIGLYRIVHGLCEKNYSRSLRVMQSIPLATFKALLQKFVANEDIGKEFLSIVVACLSSMCTYICKKHQKEPEEMVKYQVKLDFDQNVRKDCESLPLYRECLSTLVDLLADPNIPASTRDATVDGFINAIQLCKAVADFILENKGVRRMLELASLSCFAKMGQTAALAVTEKTNVHVSVALNLVYTYVYSYDQERTKFEEEAGSVIGKLLNAEDNSLNFQGLTAFSTLFQASRECGQVVSTKANFISRVLVITCYDEPMAKQLGGEALAFACSDKKVCDVISADGMDALKMLYRSKDPKTQVLGLVCLAKVTLKGGGNINENVMIEGGTLKLYDACRKYVSNDKKHVELKKWVCEALGFLTLDAEVKEILVDDKNMLNMMLELAKDSEDNTIVYAVCNALVNLTNSYDKRKIDEEMIKLAEYAKQPIPEEHAMDSVEYVDNRISQLVDQGVVEVLISLSKSAKSDSSREMISRVFYAVCSEKKHRGAVVQQGGVKALLPLTTTGNERGMDMASTAIARIGITTDPRLAFPGQRAFEMVRPLVRMIDFRKEPLEQYEGMLALTNMASMNDEIRKRIVKEGGLKAIETIMFDADAELRTSAVQCMLNMVMLKEVFDKFKDWKDRTDRLKLAFVYCGEDPPELAESASAICAILTKDEEICNRLMKINSKFEILKYLVTHESITLQIRGLYIIANMCEATKRICQDFLDHPDFIAAIKVIEKTDRPDFADRQKEATRAMKAIRSHKLKIEGEDSDDDDDLD